MVSFVPLDLRKESRYSLSLSLSLWQYYVVLANLAFVVLTYEKNPWNWIYEMFFKVFDYFSPEVYLPWDLSFE